MDILPIRIHATVEQESAGGKVNFAGFDAVRAFAALGVVLLHSGVPYLENPMPGLVWPVHDGPSAVIDCLTWGIEIVIMPIFLVLAGFLAWHTIQRRGAKRLVISRAKRLLIPLAFGLMVVLPIDLYIWVLGWVGEGLVDPVKLKSLKIGGQRGQNLWGLSHLWFLQYLFLYIITFAGIHYLANRFASSDRSRRQRAQWRQIKPTALTVGCVGAAVLALRPEVVWGFQHAFAPVPSKWLYSGTYFVGGLLLAIHDPRLDTVGRYASRLAVPAALCMIATISLGRWHLANESTQLAQSTLAVLTTMTAWVTTLALIGWTSRRITPLPVSIRYLAAASFWVYITHHPLLGLIHIDLKYLVPSLSPIAKFAIAFSLSVGACLSTYEVLVRKTALGRWLGFDWELPTVTDHTGDVAEDATISIGTDDEQVARAA
ncbi:MAG: acyltransferase [Pirellulaceae bacterium]|nr:acyltransferase [Pirellulaceae bacterium]